MFWQMIETRRGGYVWKSRDGMFQLTGTDVPPDTTAGYVSIDVMLRVKGLTLR